jgi:hypothetical protein
MEIAEKLQIFEFTRAECGLYEIQAKIQNGWGLSRTKARTF